MRSTVFLGLLLLSKILLGQSCSDCKIRDLCKHYIGTQYTEIELAELQNNYSDFEGHKFTQSIENHYPLNVHHIALKFDALGCIYPNFIDTMKCIDIQPFFEDSQLDQRKFYSKSFYHIFNKSYWANQETKWEVIKNVLDPNGKIKINTGTEYFDEDFEFIREWNNEYLTPKIQEIQKEISNCSECKVFAFIPGFNVPYSLAKLQAIEIAKKLSENSTNPIILLEVYWPSGSRKVNSLKKGECCSYQNYENYLTKQLYSFISNRSYLVGLTLRDVFNGLPATTKINVITHSHGASVITATLINAYSRMDVTKKFYDNCALLPNNSKDVNRNICYLMHTKEIPKQEFKVFLNAPAIPGKNTFCDIEESRCHNHYFFIGFNKKDRTVQKTKLHFTRKEKNCEYYHRIYLPISFSRHFSSTSLGCNYLLEINRMKKVIPKSLSSNFQFESVSSKREHDFFCYIEQIKFSSCLKQFFH